MKGVISRLLKPYRLNIVLQCLLTVFAAVLQVTSAVLMRDVVDAALYAPDGLLHAGVLLVLNLLLLVVIYCAGSWMSASASDRCIASLRGKILRTAAYSDSETLYDFHSGTLLNRSMEDVRTLCDGAIHALPSMVGQVARLAASFAAVLFLFPSVAVYVALAAVAAAAAVAILRPVLKKHHARVRKADEILMSCMQEDLQQLDLVKSLCAQEQMLSRFAEHMDKSLRAKRQRRFLVVGTNTALSALSHTATAVMLLWGAGQVAVHAMTYGSLTAMLQLVGQLRGPILGLSGVWTRLAAVEVAAQRLEELLRPLSCTAEPDCTEPIDAIVFQDVTFAYPGEEEPVFQNFSMELSLEQWQCLSGVSGKGKSTIFKLILGLYQPQSGRVLLRTGDTLMPCGANTRGLFAYVPQNYGLFSGSVLDNLLLAAPGADETRCREALELACAQFVYELPDGVNTLIRENNDGLSKGQLQRIAVARAILMDRTVFLLDECTSALDKDTERTMLHNLRKLGKPAILGSHRLSALSELPGVQMVPMEEM